MNISFSDKVISIYVVSWKRRKVDRTLDAVITVLYIAGLCMNCGMNSKAKFNCKH
jgi:hypothetical protein